MLPPPPPPVSGWGGRRRLRRAARDVLRENRNGASTVPSRSLYPHQWSWDSAFIAIGLRHLSPRRAQRELETLLAAQWDDGRVPHIVFNPAVSQDAYFPGPAFWRSSNAGAAAGAPHGQETSGIIQPPVHALAAWLVHSANPAASRRHGFLPRVYPRLVAWHHYLSTHRDLGGGGLAAIVHPWEAGMDNSPCWDEPLQRVEPVGTHAFRRADLAHCAAVDRPTDLDYGRYVRLAADYRDHGYTDGESGRAPHPFAVEDPGVNALLIASEHALAAIAAALPHSYGADPGVHQERAERLTRQLVERLWSPEAGQFLARDLRGDGDGTRSPSDGRTDARARTDARDRTDTTDRTDSGSGADHTDAAAGAGAGGALLRERGAAGLLPLLAPDLPPDIARALLRTATGEHFGLGTTARLLPSYDLRGAAFERHRYWRGPAWFNVNWLLERGLRVHGANARANELRADTLAAAASSGFAEYLDPYTGEACGSRDFSWTAALALDLLLTRPAPRDEPQETDRLDGPGRTDLADGPHRPARPGQLTTTERDIET